MHTLGVQMIRVEKGSQVAATVKSVINHGGINTIAT